MAKKVETSIWNNIKWIAELITAIGVIGGLGYGIGRWQSHVEHKTEIMEIRQDYNVQITNLKLDYNNRVLEMQNKIQIIEMSKSVEYEVK